MGKQQSKPPTVYVIAGPHGAGKTTFASEFLPDFVQCREFLNADLIAAGLAPFAPETQNVRAGRLQLERIGELVGDKASATSDWLGHKLAACPSGAVVPNSADRIHHSDSFLALLAPGTRCSKRSSDGIPISSIVVVVAVTARAASTLGKRSLSSATNRMISCRV